MPNEPYAWINVNDEYKILFDDELPNYYPEAWMPLYAHPAKELTDEEIDALIDSVIPMILLGGRIFYQDFAKTILKKAQENDS